MRCRSALRLALALDLGTLGPSGRARLEAHLARCVPCAARLRRPDPVGDWLREVAGSTPPTVDVRARVLREIREVPRPRVASGRSLALAAAAAVVAAAALAAALPGLRPAWPGLLALAAGAWDALLALGTAAVAAFAATAGPIARAAVQRRELWDSLGRALAGATPAAATLVVAGHVVMVATVTRVLYRDLARRPVRHDGVSS